MHLSVNTVGCLHCVGEDAITLITVLSEAVLWSLFAPFYQPPAVDGDLFSIYLNCERRSVFVPLVYHLFPIVSVPLNWTHLSNSTWLWRCLSWCAKQCDHAINRIFNILVCKTQRESEAKTLGVLKSSSYESLSSCTRKELMGHHMPLSLVCTEEEEDTKIWCSPSPSQMGSGLHICS